MVYAWLRNGISRTVPLCPGFDVDLPTLFFNQQSNASGGSLALGHATDQILDSTYGLERVISEANFI